MLTQEITTGNGVVKMIMASDPQELAEAVAAAEVEVSQTQPDINNPEDGNKVVSDVLHTDLQGGGVEPETVPEPSPAPESDSEPETVSETAPEPEPATEPENAPQEETPSETPEEQTVPQV